MERKNKTFKKEASSPMYKTNKKMDTLESKKEKSTILQGRKFHFNNKGIVKDTKDLKGTLLKGKKIFLKSSAKINSLSISTKSQTPMKVSIEALSKQTNKEDNDKEIISLEKELSHLKSEISSIDKAKKDNEKILTKKNEEFICQTALLNQKQNKLDLIKEINTKLSEKCKALQVEYDKLSEEQEQSVTISLDDLLEISIEELMDGEKSEEKSIRTYDEDQILDLLKKTHDLEKQKELLFGFLLIVMGIALQTLSRTLGGSNIKDFFAGLLLGISIVEMLAGI